MTRFPPEPNGYLHIGHAKAICLNFGVAQEYGGRCHLRFDDTNPTKEEQEYIDAIERDVRWLGFDWGQHLYHASDYFEQLYDWAEHLIRAGKAYVDDLPAEEMRAMRGTLDRARPQQPLPRARTVAENLDLFRRMRAGEFPNGARVLRAKIDMASGNINLRDPVLYRILHAAHPRTGTQWCIYPTYDFAHGQSDAIEGVTHSLCTLEFEDHRPLYDWLIDNLPVPSRPRQYEFARLNLAYTVLSKRLLTELVRRRPGRRLGRPAHADAGRAAPARRAGCGDPRLCSSGRRRAREQRRRYRDVRACDARAVEQDRAATDGGAAPAEARHRQLSATVPRGDSTRSTTRRTPRPVRGASRSGVSFLSSATTFMEDPPKKFYRLAPGREVRLRYAYFVTCREVVKNAAGEVVELRLHLRPSDARRQRARRAQGPGDPALGRGSTRAAGRDPPL